VLCRCDQPRQLLVLIVSERAIKRASERVHGTPSSLSTG
jgi:hypothetical protein